MSTALASVREWMKRPISIELPVSHGTLTTGKIGVAVQFIFAVCPRTSKISLPCARRKTHGKDFSHGKDRHERTAKTRFTATTEESARQKKLHGNESPQPTAKIWCTTKHKRASSCTSLPSIALPCDLCRAYRTLYRVNSSTAKTSFPVVTTGKIKNFKYLFMFAECGLLETTPGKQHITW
jgi:hypothetical protein